MEFPREIYAIKHKVTKRIYIGSTHKTIEERYKMHMGDLKRGSHKSSLMQEDFDTYGEQYDVYRLGRIENFSETKKEYEEMITHKTFEEAYGYNQGDAIKCKRIIEKREHPFIVKEDLSDLDEHWS